jgi:hypothetical protein
MIVADLLAPESKRPFCTNPPKTAATEQPEDRPRHFDNTSNPFWPCEVHPAIGLPIISILGQLILAVLNHDHVVKLQPPSLSASQHRTSRNIPSPTFSPQDSRATTLYQPRQTSVCIDEGAPSHPPPKPAQTGFSAACIRPRRSVLQHSCEFHDFLLVYNCL